MLITENKFITNFIFFFSGTGNSYMVAKNLFKELEDSRITSIIKYEGEKLNCNNIIVIFPVYFYNTPIFILEFIEKLNINQNAKIYVICTCGGIAGQTLSQIKKTIIKRKMKLAGSYIIKMPRTYIPEFNIQSEEKQLKLICKMNSKVSNIANDIRIGKIRKIRKNIFHEIIFKILSGQNKHSLQSADTNFWVSDKCTLCGKCMVYCPVNNITLTNSNIVWNHKCLMCFRCIHICPIGAIEYGATTIGKKRYKIRMLDEMNY